VSDSLSEIPKGNLRITPTEYTVCGLPEDDEDSAVWKITIESRGKGWWAVCHLRHCLSTGGKWDYEPLPSSRTNAWLKRHRFDLPEAIRRAEAAYPKLIINGLWVRDGKLVEAKR